MKDYYCKSKDILITRTAYFCCSDCIGRCKTILYCKDHFDGISSIVMPQVIIEYKQKLRKYKLDRILHEELSRR
jgi:hypothetical protein